MMLWIMIVYSLRYPHQSNVDPGRLLYLSSAALCPIYLMVVCSVLFLIAMLLDSAERVWTPYGLLTIIPLTVAGSFGLAPLKGTFLLALGPNAELHACWILAAALLLATVVPAVLAVLGGYAVGGVSEEADKHGRRLIADIDELFRQSLL
jgi:hypothetical protein